eukprot:TRINITY_DN18261_c0_g1_i1.p1 TRINITY_DN18261_c0_g1~~TRINITY_DN18261_c0_g1_i1.p1  ORF type:complete len:664 (+),score=195.97 TRINITY_DN18261_c0_g1_i1:82-2073(+)
MDHKEIVQVVQSIAKLTEELTSLHAAWVREKAVRLCEQLYSQIEGITDIYTQDSEGLFCLSCVRNLGLCISSGEEASLTEEMVRLMDQAKEHILLWVDAISKDSREGGPEAEVPLKSKATDPKRLSAPVSSTKLMKTANSSNSIPPPSPSPHPPDTSQESSLHLDVSLFLPAAPGSLGKKKKSKKLEMKKDSPRDDKKKDPVSPRQRITNRTFKALKTDKSKTSKPSTEKLAILTSDTEKHQKLVEGNKKDTPDKLNNIPHLWKNILPEKNDIFTLKKNKSSEQPVSSPRNTPSSGDKGDSLSVHRKSCSPSEDAKTRPTHKSISAELKSKEVKREVVVLSTPELPSAPEFTKGKGEEKAKTPLVAERTRSESPRSRLAVNGTFAWKNRKENMVEKEKLRAAEERIRVLEERNRGFERDLKVAEDYIRQIEKKACLAQECARDAEKLVRELQMISEKKLQQVMSACKDILGPPQGKMEEWGPPEVLDQLEELEECLRNFSGSEEEERGECSEEMGRDENEHNWGGGKRKPFDAHSELPRINNQQKKTNQSVPLRPIISNIHNSSPYTYKTSVTSPINSNITSPSTNNADIMQGKHSLYYNCVISKKQNSKASNLQVHPTGDMDTEEALNELEQGGSMATDNKENNSNLLLQSPLKPTLSINSL